MKRMSYFERLDKERKRRMKKIDRERRRRKRNSILGTAALWVACVLMVPVIILVADMSGVEMCRRGMGKNAHMCGNGIVGTIVLEIMKERRK